MKIACLSGKGGAGKTFLAVNLAAAAGVCCYVDCDVEEPNGRLFLKPQETETRQVYVKLPSFDPMRCTGCKACVSACRFHALMYIKEKPMVFPEVCHSCGLCSLVCPEKAISEEDRQVGSLELGRSRGIRTVTGELEPGESSGVPVIRGALAQTGEGTAILDCPPGSGCSVMECVLEADVCLLAAEPTAFGTHDLEMVWQLTALLGKPCAVVINKQIRPYAPLEDFCREKGLRVLDRIDYDPALARWLAEDKLAAWEDRAWMERFKVLLDKLGGML